MKIPEDIRPLSEFYPHEEMRHRVHFAFVFQFLPGYIFQNPFAFASYAYESGMDPQRFIQSRWEMMEQRAGLVRISNPPEEEPFRRVSDLDLWTATVAGHPGVFIEMPRPEGRSLAFYVGMVLLAPVGPAAQWPRDAKARIFTLERMIGSDGSSGLLCELTVQGEHRNSGLLFPATRDAFVESVAQRLEATGAGPA